jgi:hypothetical protein
MRSFSSKFPCPTEMRAITRNLLLLLFLTVLMSCSSAWKGPASIKSSNGTLLCARHHVPLETEKGYISDVIKDPPYAYWKIQDKYPNLIYLTAKPSGDAARLVTEQYCPACKSEYETELRRKGM